MRIQILILGYKGLEGIRRRWEGEILISGSFSGIVKFIVLFGLFIAADQIVNFIHNSVL